MHCMSAEKGFAHPIGHFDSFCEKCHEKVNQTPIVLHDLSNWLNVSGGLYFPID